jgi:hypothetical protein
MNVLEPLSLADIMEGITRVRRHASASMLTNWFGNLHSAGPFPALITEDTLLFLDADRDFRHVLFASTSPAALDRLLQCCPHGGIYALDYLTKALGHEWEEVFLRNGFIRRANYQRIASVFPKFPPVRGETLFAREDEAEYVYQLLPQVFDRYLDHLPSIEQVREMIRDRRVLVNRMDRDISGLFIFQIHGQRAHLNYWWSHPAASPNAGLELLIRAYHEMGLRAIRAVHAWVNVINDRVIRIHRHFGLNPDGLCNYIYTREN